MGGRKAGWLLLVVALGGCADNGSMPPGSAPGVTIADINVLHGLFCPPETEMCRLQERIALLFDWVEATGCPDVITLQEVTTPVLDAVRAEVEVRCPFAYQVAFQPSGFGLDDMLILSRYPVTGVEIAFLLNGFRHVVVARIEHPAFLLDVFTTHLASSSDAGSQACVNCPEACTAAGARTVRECQAVQVAEYVDRVRRSGAVVLLTGDFNAPPDSFVHAYLLSRGWIDTYAAAGNPECDPATGSGCSSGREDGDLTELESPALNVDERIDYVLLMPPEGGTCRVEPAGDPDGDGTGTGLFGAEPNPFATSCGPKPLPVCWPSDHVGVSADLHCLAADRLRGGPQAGAL